MKLVAFITVQTKWLDKKLLMVSNETTTKGPLFRSFSLSSLFFAIMICGPDLAHRDHDELSIWLVCRPFTVAIQILDDS